MFRSPVSKRNPQPIATGLLLALSITTISLTPKAVQADDQGNFTGTLTVQFTGTQVCNPSSDQTCASCIKASGFYIEAQGIANTSLGPLFAKVLKCFYPTSSPQAPWGTYAGTMTLSVTPPVNSNVVIPFPKDA
jgi:hypothetical protein